MIFCNFAQYMSSHDEQRVGNIRHYSRKLTLHFTSEWVQHWKVSPKYAHALLTTECEWYCSCFNQLVDCITWHGKQYVSGCAGMCQAVSSHLIPWPTGSEWQCSDFVPGSLIRSHPMTNRKWVAVQWFCARQSHQISSHDQQLVSGSAVILCQAVSSDLIPWPTASELFYCPFSLDGLIINNRK